MPQNKRREMEELDSNQPTVTVNMRVLRVYCTLARKKKKKKKHCLMKLSIRQNNSAFISFSDSTYRRRSCKTPAEDAQGSSCRLLLFLPLATETGWPEWQNNRSPSGSSFTTFRKLHGVNLKKYISEKVCGNRRDPNDCRLQLSEDPLASVCAGH